MNQFTSYVMLAPAMLSPQSVHAAREAALAKVVSKKNKNMAELGLGGLLLIIDTMNNFLYDTQLLDLGWTTNPNWHIKG